MMKYFNLYLMCWLLFSGIATAQSTDAQIASVLATAHQQKSLCVTFTKRMKSNFPIIGKPIFCIEKPLC